MLRVWRLANLTQDLFWKDVTNTLREEMLQVFPDITAKINRLHEIEGNPEHRDEIRDIKEYLEARDGYNLHDLQLRILTYFGFDDTYLDRVVTQLSGGEQMKVQIAKFIIQEVDILILDEPTNHLDIEWIVFRTLLPSLEKGHHISISHDVTFINNTCQKNRRNLREKSTSTLETMTPTSSKNKNAMRHNSSTMKYRNAR